MVLTLVTEVMVDIEATLVMSDHEHCLPDSPRWPWMTTRHSLPLWPPCGHVGLPACI